MPRYGPVDPKADFPRMEERVLAFWNETGVFAESLARREGSPEWVFYDGPPTANNRPHVGHVEARTFKDLFPRYRTMTGHYVSRKAGWDCHGLPVEVEVEKQIGTRSKRDIEAFGIARFVELCRESVQRYVDDWRRMSERQGFWIDLDGAYWTMSTDYVQSVWWALKQLHGQGLLYQDYKVTAYCPRCGTGLSDAEVALGYREVEDPSIYVRFPILTGALAGEADLLVWTTMPWTLVPATLAVVSEELTYVVAHGGAAGDRPVVLAANRVDDVLGDGARVVRRVGLDELLGSRYRAPFDLVGPGSPSDPDGDPATWRFVVAGDFVRADEGTGVVHTGAAFGEDDLRTARANDVSVVNPVDAEGRFDERVTPYAGLWVREADPLIIEDLRRADLLLAAGTYTHPFPFCWRCDTPLLYYARRSWYVRTTARKDDLLGANEGVNWYPETIKHGRYGDWLRNNVDWSLSRERYWGTPLPVWRCEAQHDTVVGSLDELSDLAGRDVTGVDPHRPAIDEVTIPCPECGGEARRVLEVIDAWFDSGAMPFAQWGYRGSGSPGEEPFRLRFPADFIAEGLDQTRGWFYSMMVEGVLLFGENPYQNVICHGLVVDAEGRKMSKRLGNVVEPMAAFDRVGADAVRWFMVASGSPWSNRRLTLEILDDVVRRFLLTLWNLYAFYVTYANVDEPTLGDAPPPAERPALDRWALSRLHVSVGGVRAALDGYDVNGAARRIEELVHDLSNWYVRRARRRFWDPARTEAGGAGGDEAGSGPRSTGTDKASAYATLFELLTTVTRLLAPFTPFVAEELYRNLALSEDPSAARSVHLTDYPVSDDALVDPELEASMALARSLVSLGRMVRTEAKVRVRQPLSHAVVHVPGDPSSLDQVLPLVAEELNVKEVHFAGSADELARWRAKPNFRVLGPRLGRQVQEVAAALGSDDGTLAARLARGESVELALASGPVTLAPPDVELVQQDREGWAMAADGPFAVALELALTEELRQEGLARELVHHLQALRRSAGLRLTDRIQVSVEAGPGSVAMAALRGQGSRIAGEVLATRVGAGPLEGGSSERVTLDGSEVTIWLRPADAPGTARMPDAG
jgi:isoleucyl-tRNA synthetase